MKKILFVSDLDNTIIHSYKHKRLDDICIEFIDNKEQGFMSKESYEIFEYILKKVIFVPITTRSVQQYKRIKWKDNCNPKYAVTTNGGILLNNFEIDKNWLQKSNDFVLPYILELQRLYNIFCNKDSFIKCRIVDNMFLFLHCKDNNDINKYIEEYKLTTNLDIMHFGNKIYFFPPYINKGIALKRLKEIFEIETIICAGDSTIDIPMLNLANISIVPNENIGNMVTSEKVEVCKKGEHFSDYILKYILKM